MNCDRCNLYTKETKRNIKKDRIYKKGHTEKVIDIGLPISMILFKFPFRFNYMRFDVVYNVKAKEDLYICKHTCQFCNMRHILYDPKPVLFYNTEEYGTIYSSKQITKKKYRIFRAFGLVCNKRRKFNLQPDFSLGLFKI